MIPLHTLIHYTNNNSGMALFILNNLIYLLCIQRFIYLYIFLMKLLIFFPRSPKFIVCSSIDISSSLGTRLLTLRRVKPRCTAQIVTGIKAQKRHITSVLCCNDISKYLLLLIRFIRLTDENIGITFHQR